MESVVDDAGICCRALPASKCICETEIKATNKQSILRKGSLAVAVKCSHIGRRRNGNMAAICCTDRMLKIRVELWVLKDLEQDGLTGRREYNIFGIKWWSGKYVENCFEITAHSLSELGYNCN